jgi:dual specificity phosphatase 12
MANLEDRAMHCIRPGLWLGNREAATNVKELERHGVSRMVTVVRGLPLSARVTDHLKAHLIVPIDDDMDADLLAQLEACFEFLLQPDAGAVLVHCMAGVSRSTAVVMAYLMHTERLSADAALEDIQHQRSYASPNENFMEQLQIYEAMEAPRVLIVQHRLYRGFLMSKVADRVQTDFNLVADLPMASDPLNTMAAAEEATYRCRSCRRVLFHGNSVLHHLQPTVNVPLWRSVPAEPSEPIVAGLHDENGVKRPPICRKELFLEPVEWMRESLLTMQAKLSCPKCSAKLGTCSWLGVRCGCGSWVCPSVHIPHSKVDMIMRSQTQRETLLGVIAPPVTSISTTVAPLMSASSVILEAPIKPI